MCTIKCKLELMAEQENLVKQSVDYKDGGSKQKKQVFFFLNIKTMNSIFFCIRKTKSLRRDEFMLDGSMCSIILELSFSGYGENSGIGMG